MLNQELRFPILTHFTLGTPFGDVGFPEVQGGLFVDVGKATFPTGIDRALLGSYGLGFLALAQLLVLRLYLGRRFTDDNYQGYGLSGEQRQPGFVYFWFGYNY